MNKKLGKIMFITVFGSMVIFALNYSGKVAKQKRYQEYATEPVKTEDIFLIEDYKKELVSDTESFEITFRKDWIPKVGDQEIKLNELIKREYDTSIIMDKVYYTDADHLTMMLSFNQDTKKLHGKFLDYTNKLNQTDLKNDKTPAFDLMFFHKGEAVSTKYSFGLGQSMTVGLPIETLKKFNYQVDIIVKGLELYEYQYTGN